MLLLLWRILTVYYAYYIKSCCCYCRRCSPEHWRWRNIKTVVVIHNFPSLVYFMCWHMPCMSSSKSISCSSPSENSIWYSFSFASNDFTTPWKIPCFSPKISRDFGAYESVQRAGWFPNRWRLGRGWRVVCRESCRHAAAFLRCLRHRNCTQGQGIIR